MDSKALIGIVILLFTYSLFSWALGRQINKKKQPRPTEFQSFLTGSWIVGLIVVLLIAWLYWG